MVSWQSDFSLAELTAFGVGGQVARFGRASDSQQLLAYLQTDPPAPVRLLGQGTNLLVADGLLPGTVINVSSPHYSIIGPVVWAEAGLNWDRLVAMTVSRGLWGLELLSGIPGTVGAAAVINVNAYGQSLADNLIGIEVYDSGTRQPRVLPIKRDDWGYKRSPVRGQFVTRVGWRLSRQPTTKLLYPSALDYAKQKRLKPTSLDSRRRIILAVRDQAGSLYTPDGLDQAQTCGSYFKNPVVARRQLKTLFEADESGQGRRALRRMNRLQGGQTTRVSAALVLLAAGFRRGQTFGRVRLHPDHVLKLENYQQASATEIYQVGVEIQSVVKDKLGILLEPEIAFWGNFGGPNSKPEGAKLNDSKTFK